MKKLITVTLSILQLVTAQVKMRDDQLNGTLINEESLIYKETSGEVLNETLTINSELPITTELDEIVPETTKLLSTSTLQLVITTDPTMTTTKKLQVTEEPTEITLTDLIETNSSKLLDTTSPQAVVTALELSLTTTKVSVTEETKSPKTLETTSPQTLTVTEVLLTKTKVSMTEESTEMTLINAIETNTSKTLDTTSPQTVVTAPELSTTTKLSMTEDRTEITLTDLIVTKSLKPLEVTSPQTLVTAPELSLTTTKGSLTEEPAEIIITYQLDPVTKTSKTLATTSPQPTVTSTEPSITTTTNLSVTGKPTEIAFTDRIVPKVSESLVTTSPKPSKQLLPNDTLTDRLQSTDSPVKTDKHIVTTGSEEITTTEFNPCLQEEPKMPNFSVPGRRISEIKCKEYLWQIEQRKNLTQKDIDCTLYEINKHGYTEMFAVAGGRDAYHGEFPHMAAIGWKGTVNQWEFKCGGTLISPNFVLTAAHCTKVSSRDTTVADPSPKIVRLGVANIKTAAYFPPSDYGITKIILHPQYKAPKQYYDIALMELDFNIQFNYIVHPACLWTSFDTSDIGVQTSVTGWGVLQSAPIPIGPPSILQVGVVDFIDSQLCDELLRPSCNRKQCGIEDHQICAGILAGGVDACQGDSGGPLQVKIPLQDETEEKMYYVVGVTSFGIGCALENSPGVYSRVSSFIDWIEEIVWPQSV